MLKVANAYFQTQMTTTSQGDVLLMLYDGAINFLQQAKERIEAKDPAKKGLLISKAMDIVNELDCTLNMEKGGDLGSNLHSLYLYCNKRLLTANIKMDSSIIDEVVKILSGLRAAFAEISNQPEAQAAAQSVAATIQAGGSKAERKATGMVGTGVVPAAETQAAATRRNMVYAKQMASAGVNTSGQQAPIHDSASTVAPSSTIPSGEEVTTQQAMQETPSSPIATGAEGSSRPSRMQLYKKFTANQAS